MWHTVVHRVGRIVAAASVAILLAVSVSGPIIMAQMAQHHHGAPMVGCPFMGTAALCPMNSVDHVGLMRSLLLGVISGAMVLCGVVFLPVALRCAQWQSSVHRQSWRTAVRYPVLHPFAILGSYLHQALAHGLLHPKVYPSVAV